MSKQNLKKIWKEACLGGFTLSLGLTCLRSFLLFYTFLQQLTLVDTGFMNHKSRGIGLL